MMSTITTSSTTTTMTVSPTPGAAGKISQTFIISKYDTCFLCLGFTSASLVLILVAAFSVLFA